MGIDKEVTEAEYYQMRGEPIGFITTLDGKSFKEIFYVKEPERQIGSVNTHSAFYLEGDKYFKVNEPVYLTGQGVANRAKLFFGTAPIITSVKSGTNYEYRKDAKDELKKLQNSYVINKHTGEKIYFTMLSINELLFEAGANKLRALFHIKEIVENATPVSVEEITKFNNALKRNSDFLYNMESMIMIDGQWFNYCFKTFVKLDEDKNKINRIVIYSGHLPQEKPI